MPRSGKARQLATQVGPLIAEYTGLRTPPEPASHDAPAFEPDAWAAAGLGACWIGQATMLLRIGGRTILTDPHFGEHAVPKLLGRPAGRRRSTPLPMSIADLPPIDLLLLSHAHMDHWEKSSLRSLADPRVTAVIPHRTRGLLPRRGRVYGDVRTLRWGESTTVGPVGVAAIRPNHWGARYLVDRFRGYNAYLVEADGKRILFAGDTGETDAFDHLADHGGVDLLVIGIGNAYEPWHMVHTSPEQAASMAERMGARMVAPVHHGTFHDPREPRDEPLERFLGCWPAERTVCRRIGSQHTEG